MPLREIKWVAMFDAASSEVQFTEQPKPKVSPLRPGDMVVRGRRPFEGRVDSRKRKRFKAQTRTMPKCPGVYFFYGHKGRLLYIGKAKCLRERVRSYFADTSLPRPPKIRRLLAEITRFEWRECGSEIEALLLERRLIVELQPIVNRALKEFEIYPYLLLTDEAFPRLTFTRAEPVEESEEWLPGAGDESEDDELFAFPAALAATSNKQRATSNEQQATSNLQPETLNLENPPRLGEVPGFYLGPFTTAHAARWTLEAVRNLFPLRTCEGELHPNPNGRACFYYEIKRCAAPCIAAVSQDEYAALCADLVRALESGEAPQIERLRARMMRLADDLRFEEAQQLKVQLQALESVAVRLGRLRRMRDEHNVVIVQPAKNEESQPTVVALFLVRGGLVRRHLPRVGESDWPGVRAILREVYTVSLPARPFTAKHELDEMMILDRWLQAHGKEDCCVWLNDLSSRQWAAVAARRLEKWARS